MSIVSKFSPILKRSCLNPQLFFNSTESLLMAMVPANVIISPVMQHDYHKDLTIDAEVNDNVL
jgi:hypothetical protein